MEGTQASVLISGGNGFIASHIVAQLIEVTVDLAPLVRAVTEMSAVWLRRYNNGSV